MENNQLRHDLLSLAKQAVQTRLEELRQSISEIQAAANEETKSTAGDKYETGRAMAHLEIEKLQQQLLELTRSLEVFRQINPGNASLTIQMGSIVITSQGNFFLSSSIGDLVLNNNRYTCISLASPLAGKMIGKKRTDQVVINTRELIIQDIF